MKRKTYNNMIKATKMIADKGYQWEEANQIAISCFEQMKQASNGMEVEWFINQIITKEEYEKNKLIMTSIKSNKVMNV